MNIVERLRNTHISEACEFEGSEILTEAADTIEALECALREAMHEWARWLAEAHGVLPEGEKWEGCSAALRRVEEKA